MGTLLAAVALLACAGGDDHIQWGDKKLKLDELPADLPETARSAIQLWAPWAREGSFRLDLDPTSRVLLITHVESGHVEKQLELTAAVIARFDQELPAPAVRRTATPPALVAEAPPPKEPKRENPLPEDPEDPEGDHPWKLEPRRPDPPTVTKPVVTTWGAAEAALDSQTVVMIVVPDVYNFRLLLASLAKTFPLLEKWASEARAQQGFVLPYPPVGCYVQFFDGQEEWDADHELVSRLARLCLVRRYGELPNWFTQGYAWHMEMAIQKAVYCFPWRSEFVYADEHMAWPRMVKKLYERERVKPASFLGWKRGKFEGDAARTSWAVTEFLVAQEAAKVPELLDELRVFAEEHSRVQDGPSKWHRDTEYEIPLADQAAIMKRVFGEDYLTRATTFIREGLGN